MSDSELSRISDEATLASKPDDDGIFDKLAREAYVLGAGSAMGIGEGAKQSIDDPAGTFARIGVAAGVGIALGASQRSAGLLRLGGEALGAGLGLAFTFDVLGPSRWDAVSKAMEDTWNSDKNTDKNADVVAKNLGRFIFDTGLMMGAGLGGAKLGSYGMTQFTLTQGRSGVAPTEPPPAMEARRPRLTEEMSAEDLALLHIEMAQIESPYAAANARPVHVVRLDVPRLSEIDPVQPFSKPVHATPEQVRLLKSKQPVVEMPVLVETVEGANGVKTFKFADGSLVESRPDGSILRTEVNGTKTTSFKDGQRLTQNIDGSSVLQTPDGMKITANTDGTRVMEMPNGVTYVTHLDGTITGSRADGAKWTMETGWVA